jgi:hypothetical protein
VGLGAAHPHLANPGNELQYQARDPAADLDFLPLGAQQQIVPQRGHGHQYQGDGDGDDGQRRTEVQHQRQVGHRVDQAEDGADPRRREHTTDRIDAARARGQVAGTVGTKEHGGQGQQPCPHRRLQDVVHAALQPHRRHAGDDRERHIRQRDDQHAKAQLHQEPALPLRDGAIDHLPGKERYDRPERAHQQTDPQ